MKIKGWQYSLQEKDVYTLYIYKISLTLMLKSLMSKIKSQKCSSISSKRQQGNDTKVESATLKPIGNYQFSQLQQQSIVLCNISKIRYSIQQWAPDIFNKVLACPISVFNQLPYAKRKVKEIDLKKEPFPEYLRIVSELLRHEIPQFNHVLVNVYSPGIGIMPHFDGPMYRSKVVVLSLGGPAIINFTNSYGSSNNIASLLLEDKSIHIFQSQAYQKCLHGVADYTIDSIFLFIHFDQKLSTFQIKFASVGNFKQTRINRILLQKLKILKTEIDQISEIDISKQYGSLCCLLSIKQNEEYNWKIQLVRKERISITIRQRYNQ